MRAFIVPVLALAAFPAMAQTVPTHPAITPPPTSAEVIAPRAVQPRPNTSMFIAPDDAGGTVSRPPMDILETPLLIAPPPNQEVMPPDGTSNERG